MSLLISLNFSKFSTNPNMCLLVKNFRYSKGLYVGGGINSDNALSYIEEGASHIIVTSVCFYISLPVTYVCMKATQSITIESFHIYG